jgi:lipopolysaccharide export system permease protein
MKIFERYITTSVLVPLVGALFTLSAMWVVYDMVERLNDFLRAGVNFGGVALFYFRQLPGMIPALLPVAILLAVLSALAGMVKNGEIIALFSGGVGIMRISMPFLIIGTLMAVSQVVLETTHAPLALRERNEQMEEFRAQARNRDRRSGPKLRNLVYFNEKQKRAWFIRRADTSRQELSDVEIIQLDSDANDVWKIFARQMFYINGKGWKSGTARRITLSSGGTISGESEDISGSFIRDLDETFNQVAAAVYTADMLTYSELQAFIRDNQQLGTKRLAPYSSTLVRQLWGFAPCLGAVLIALGLCLKASSRSGLGGFGLPIVFYITYMLFDHFFMAMAKSSRLPVEVAVAIPHLGWLTLGIWLFLKRLNSPG